MKRKKVLVLNLGWEQEPLLDALQKHEFELYGIHYNEAYYRAPQYRDLLLTDLRNLEKIIAYAEGIQPDAVISDQCDYSYFAQAVIAQKLGLPGPHLAQAQMTTNKYLQRQKALAAGVKVPHFRICYHQAEILPFYQEHGFPLILKPVDNRGGFGVHRVDRPAEIKDAFGDALIHSHSRQVIVEKYIEGRHITVDGYCFPGKKPQALALATKDKIQDKKEIIDGRILYPGDLPGKRYHEALKNAEFTSHALGLNFGYFHGEFILTETEIYLTEMANRGGGVWTSEIIVPYVSGVDLVEQYIQDCLGCSKMLSDFQPESHALMMDFFQLKGARGKRIKQISGINQVKADPQVLAFRMLVQKGDIVSSITNGAQRHGVIIVKGESKAKLHQYLDHALDYLKIDYE